MINIKKILIKEKESLLSAILKLNKTGTRCLFVVGEKNIFKGTLTDGDIRRCIAKNKNFNLNIKNVYNKRSFFIYKEKKNNSKKIKKFFKKNKNQLIPVLNKKKVPVEYLSDQTRNKLLNQDNLVLIMAGGKGTRLKPFTDILPKPLIPINRKPMIINILDKFRKNNFNNFLISLRENDKILKSFLTQFQHKYKLNFLEESSELGSAGSIKLMKNQKKPFFVINCDTLVKVNPKRILNAHYESKSLMSMVVCLKSYKIPYGECNVNKLGFLKNINEKPSNKLMANVGMYVMNPEILKYVKNYEKLNMDKLIEKLLKNKKKICVFPIKEDEWIDTGNWNNYFEASIKR
jgi:dTDP-glucose pyrophosphorylase